VIISSLRLFYLIILIYLEAKWERETENPKEEKFIAEHMEDADRGK
jgi:hypothetical protein